MNPTLQVRGKAHLNPNDLFREKRDFVIKESCKPPRISCYLRGFLRATFLFLGLTALALFAPQANAQTQGPPPGKAARPILFVNGFCGDSAAWQVMRDDIRFSLVRFHSTLGYANSDSYDSFYDGQSVNFSLNGNSVSFSYVPTDARFFSIRLFDQIHGTFQTSAVAQISILHKAEELAQVIRAITQITHVRDVIVVAHSMGGLVARAYLERLASPLISFCDDQNGYSTCRPGTVAYGNDVGHLVTVDSPHGGAALSTFGDDLLGGCPALPSTNKREMLPTSILIQSLNYHPAQAINGIPASTMPQTTKIDAITSFYRTGASVRSTYFGTDGILTAFEQSIVESLRGFVSLTNQYIDIPNPFDSHPTSCGPLENLLPFIPSNPLHLLECVGAQPETRQKVNDAVFPVTQGDLTAIHVQATVDGTTPWPGPLRFDVVDSNGTTVKSGTQIPMDFYDLPLGSYTIRFVNGGPPSASLPQTIAQPQLTNQTCPTSLPCATIQSGQWAITFTLQFTSPNVNPQIGVSPASGTLGVTGFQKTGTGFTPNGSITQRVTYPDGSVNAVHTRTADATGGYSYPVTYSNQVGTYSQIDTDDTTGKTSNTITWAVTAAPPPSGFSIDVTPASQMATAGSPASYVISTTAIGSPITVFLRVCNVPTGITPQLNQASVTSGGAASLTLTTSSNTAAGNYTLTILGSDISLSCGLSEINPGSNPILHQRALSLTVNAPVAGSPAVSFNPSPLPFGDVQVGNTSQYRLVSYTNTGAANLNVQSIVGDSDFIVQEPCTGPLFAQGTGCTFKVVFAPQAVGLRAGQIKLYSNAPGSPATLTVSGRGLAPPTTTGTVQVKAFVNGQAWSGPIGVQGITLTGPTTISSAVLPASFTLPAGDYTVTVNSGPGGASLSTITPAATQSLTAGGTVTFNLNFSAANDFFPPFFVESSRFVNTGSSTLFGIGFIAPTGNFPGPVDLTVFGVPSGANSSISPNPASAGVNSTLTVNVGAQTVPGSYVLSSSGTSGTGLTHTGTNQAILVVTSPPPQPPELTSVSSLGTQGNAAIFTRPSVSADGRFVAFASSANNLVANDQNGFTDIFVRDRQTGTTTLVSLANDGSQSNFDSNVPAITTDGRYVVFNSNAGNLIGPGQPTFANHLFLRDLLANATAQLDVTSNGSAGNGGVNWPSAISADGRFVAFVSSSTNLMPGGTNGQPHAFVLDRQTKQFELVSVASDGTEGNGASAVPSISADGRFVSFVSSATNLVANDLNNQGDVFVRDRQTGQTIRVSVVSDGTESNGSASTQFPPAISADGRFVTFRTGATNLVPMATSGIPHVYLHDRRTGVTILVSAANDGTPLPGGGFEASISSDGRFVAFRTEGQILLRDLSGQRTLVVSLAGNGSAANANTSLPAISADGRVVSFLSDATDLVSGDVNNFSDVFVAANPVSLTGFLKSVTLAASSVTSGTQLTGVVTLDVPAPTGDALVTLSSNSPSVTVPSTVAVPAGQLSANFTVATTAGNKEILATIVASYDSRSPFAILTLSPSIPNAITVTSGDSQSAVLGVPFTTPLQAKVVDVQNNPLPGVNVTFTAPAPGASGSFGAESNTTTAVTDANGIATAAAFTANNVAGNYTVTASVSGLTSTASFALTNANPSPVLISMAPTQTTAGDPPLVLTVAGSNFVPGSKVLWNGADRTQGYVDSVQLQASIVAADIAATGTATITVFNPAPGGGTSSALTFTINPPPKPVVVLNRATIDFGTIRVGVASTSQDVIVLNNGQANLVIGQVSPGITSAFQVSADNCTSQTIAVGGSCKVTVVFQPNAPGTASVTLSIPSNSPSSPDSVTLTGLGTQPALSLSGSTLPFGLQRVGTSSTTQSVTLSNTGNQALTISGIALSGTNAGDFSQTDNCGTGIAAGSTCVVSVVFSPTGTGARAAVVTITDDAPGSPHSFSLTGTGIAPSVILSASNLAFGNQLIGLSSAPQMVTLSNTGTDTLNISSISTSASFAQTNTCGATVAALANCTISVSFSPTTTGGSAGSLTIADDASGSPRTIHLIGTGVVPVVTLSPSSVSFGNQLVATTSATQSVTLTNSGTGPLTISAITFSGNNPGDFAQSNGCPFAPSTLVTGANCVFTLTFTPSTTGPRNAQINLTNNTANSPHKIDLSGTGVAPASSQNPTSLSFGNQRVGTTSSPQVITMSNGGTAALSISNIFTSAEYSQTNTCGSLLAIGTSCTISVTFSPSAAGSRSGSVTIADNAAGSPHILALSGTGIEPVVGLSPNSLSFGSQVLTSTSAAQTVTLSNTGSDILKLLSIGVSGDFALTHNCGTSLATNANCTINVTFAPTATGDRIGTLSVNDDANGSPHTVSLTGKGFDISVNPQPGSSTTQTVLAGQAATYMLSLAPVSGFSGTATLSCANLPTATNCSFSSNPVQLGGNGANFSLSISTTRRSLLVLRWPEPPTRQRWFIPLMVTVFIMMSIWIGASMAKKANRLGARRVLGPAFLTAALILFLSNCGGGGGSSPPPQPQPFTAPGTYTVSVNANLQNATRSFNVTLVVQ